MFERASRNTIHPTAIIHAACDTSKWGEGNYIGPYCVVGPFVTMGSGNRFEAYCSIGTPPEKFEFFDSPGQVQIGSSNVVREFVSINGGSQDVTRIGHQCTLLRGCHVSHDTILEDDVILSCNVMLGGESYVMQGANLGLGVVAHQRTLVGSWVMVGMGSVIQRGVKLQPGGKYYGVPCEWHGYNPIGIERNQVNAEELVDEIERWKKLREERCKATS